MPNKCLISWFPSRGFCNFLYYMNLMKCIRASFFFIFLLMHFHQALSQNKDTLVLTLSSAVQKAFSDNQNLAQNYLDVERAERESGIATGRFIPTVNIGGNYTRNIKRPVFFIPEGSAFGGGQSNVIEVGFDNSFTGTLEGSVPVFNLELYRGLQLARLSQEIAEMNLQAAKNELEAQVKQAYLNALIAKELVIVQLLSLENAKRNLEDIKNQYEEGVAAEYDYLRSRVNVENIRPNVVEARINYQAALNQLRLLTGTPADRPMELDGGNVQYYQQVGNLDLKPYSVTENPELKALHLQEKIRETEVELQQAGLYPSLNAFGNYQYLGQENHLNLADYRWVNTSQVGLNLNFSLFQGLIRRRQIQQTEIQQQIVQRQYEYLENSLNVQAEDALNRLRLARTSIEAQRDNVQLAEKAYEIAQVSYRNGIARLIELNDAEFALTEARVNFITAINNYLGALVEYERILGRNIAQIE